MKRVNNYKSLINIFRKFNKKETEQKLDLIFNSKNSKINWSKIPVHLVTK